MTPIERAATKALGRCSFLPGIAVKRFARDMAAKPDEFELSVRQAAYLWKSCWKYRRQLPAEIVQAAILQRPDPDVAEKPAKPQKLAFGEKR